MRVALADYGAGNLRSVQAALVRAGADPHVTTDPDELHATPLAVIAGVGHLGSATRGLAERGLDEALVRRTQEGRPTLGICVGMQILFDESEEGGRGLGLIPGRVTRVRARRVPHMGWNALRVTRPCDLLERLDGAHVYFAHSFAVEPANGAAVAEVDHDGAVVAAIQSGPLAGFQFHPERSGEAGALALENALAWSASA